VQAYNILRRSAGLLLSLVNLMAGATITDLAADPSKALLKLQVPPFHRRAPQLELQTLRRS